MSGGIMNMCDLAAGDGFSRFSGGEIKSEPAGVLVAADRKKMSVKVAAGVCARLLLLHTDSSESLVEIELAEDASLSVMEICLCGCYSDVVVRQAAGSSCNVGLAELNGGSVSYRAELNGSNAGWRFSGVFVGTDSDRCSVSLNTRHNVADCTSDSIVKGVVSGRAGGEFRGLVYVAPDAQHTDARQQSRNIELGTDSHIATHPQLEIYADDVKCSHGATVGHRDEEALFYMRQRGIGERDAQRLQIEGFVKDIVRCCPIEQVREALENAMDEKLAKL